MKEIRQTKEYANYLKTQNWIIEKIDDDNVFIKKIPLLGSLIKYQRPLKPDIKKLFGLAKKYRGFYIVVELSDKNSYKEFLDKGFKVTSPYLPSKTLILDISPQLDVIYNGLSKDARYSIRKAEDVKVKEINDLESFQKSWKSHSAISRYVLSLSQLKNFKKAFSKDMVLLTNESLDSGAMFLVADGIGYYWYGFTSANARKSHVQYKIIFEGIKWAKKRGAKKFDFEGIYDARFPNKNWKGFTRFKRKFAGKDVEYPACLAKWELKNIFRR